MYRPAREVIVERPGYGYGHRYGRNNMMGFLIIIIIICLVVGVMYYNKSRFKIPAPNYMANKSNKKHTWKSSTG